MRAAAAALGLVPTVALAAADGAYFPSAWGWPAVGFLLVAVAAALVRDRVAAGTLTLAYPLLLAAFACWLLLSVTWSPGATLPVHEAQRAAVYAAAAAAALLLVRAEDVDALLLGITAGTAVVACWTLVVEGFDDTVEGPIGYANALAALMVVGVLVGAHVARGRPWALVLAAPQFLVLWLTYSRGAWVALVVGAIVAAALAVPRRVRWALAAAAACLLIVAAAAGGFERASAAFSAAPVREESLGDRIVSASGNFRSDYWRVAWGAARDQPLLGAGAGDFQRAWARERPNTTYARDAHNLYLETLAEVGPLGLALLVAALLVPAAGATRAPVAAGAYAAFLAHAALDWDWEIPAVTVPAVLVGAALVRLREPAERPLTSRARVAVLAACVPVLAFTVIGQIGNSLVSRANDALNRGDVDTALADADQARRWAPWSYEPWQVTAEAGGGREAYREAVSREPESWELWWALAQTGDERAEARAEALNPRLHESP